ncbi:MAG: DUF3419 family protein [Candidatus Sericytochromatia bacterium]|nr:DUF3419 family protein [Candidatus Tanganyikabacteria bacterium]
MSRNAAKMPVGATRALAARPFHRGIGYANCWEDARILQQALEPQPGHRILSIASGGCNSLALLASDPAEVVVVDMNLRQLQVLELKMAAIAHLDHEDKLALLGEGGEHRRLQLYRSVRPALSPDARQFFDDHPDILRTGLLGAGHLERYMLAFGRLLRLGLGRDFVHDFVRLEHPEEQARRFAAHWQGLAWRTLFRVFFSRTVLERAKDPAHFREVTGDALGDRLRARAEHILTALPMRENPYMRLILEGTFGEDESGLPFYLSKAAQPILASRLDRITPRHGTLVEALNAGPFDRFNLSNIFDWMPEGEVRAVHATLGTAATPGARLCWWNTLLTRRMPDLPDLEAMDDLAEHLLRKDRFIYANFRIGRFRQA